MNQDRWLVIVEDDGVNNMGIVLGHIYVDTEEQADDIKSRRGELCDALGLFIGEPIPEYLVIEVMPESEFYECYGNRMPLQNECKL